ncbi:DUF6531 domain-containing protein, partial [Methylobacterium fujisawaense]
MPVSTIGGAAVGVGGVALAGRGIDNVLTGVYEAATGEAQGDTLGVQAVDSVAGHDAAELYSELGTAADLAEGGAGAPRGGGSKPKIQYSRRVEEPSPSNPHEEAPPSPPHEEAPPSPPHEEAPPAAPREEAPPPPPHEEAPPAAPVTAGEPVSVATGEYLETWHDFLVPGALPLDGARYMGLQMPDATGWPGPLGPCQISVFDEYFDNYAPGHLAFHQADGRRIAFERPFNFLAAKNTGSPHLELTAPWLKQLRLKDRRLLKHFRQYPDGFYRLERIEDLSGNALRLTRDPAGVLLRVERSDGLALAFDNDAAGRRTGITLIGLGGASLRLAAYGYDGNGRMAHADCAFGMSVQYEWQPDRPLLARWHNRTRRSETVFSYDEAGRVVHTETTGLWNGDRFLYDAQARRTTYLPGGDEAKAQVFAYDAHDNVTAETDALGATTCHSFDRYGFRTATTDAAGYTARTRYDIFGNVKSHIDAEGRETLYGWGPEGQLDIVVDGAGNVRRNEYDAQANLAAETNAEGHRTVYERDAHGRIVLTRFPDGTEERRAYDAGGWLASVTDARGGVTRFGYDAFGRLVETTDPLGRTTRLAYAAGPGGFATPTGLTRPDGTTVARAFDPEGALASVTDGEGRTWRYHHGAFDVLEAIEDPNGGTLTLGYDGEGRLTQVTNALGRRYALERDAAGRVVAEVDFDGRVTRYTRDVVGRVSETVRPDGARLVYGYDRTGLVTGIQVFGPDGRRQDQVAYGYDRRGLLVEARNEATRVEYIRDRDGRIVEEDVGGRRVQSRYDACGRRVARRIFSGIDQPHAIRLGEHVTRHAYDPLGALAALVVAEHAPLAFTQDGLGREVRRESTAGFVLDSAWDAGGRLSAQRGGRAIRGLAGAVAAQRAGLAADAARPIERSYAWDRADAPTAIVERL